MNKHEAEIRRRLSYDPLTGAITYRVPIKGRQGGCVAGSLHHTGYRRVRVDNKEYLHHRLAFLLMGQPIPAEVDHINGNPLDNRWVNLRACGKSENGMNRAAITGSMSGIKNVYWRAKRRKWEVVVVAHKSPVYCGIYANFELAELVAAAAREKFHGEFANHKDAR